MPRYYFHLHNDTDTVDELGKEFPNLAAARAEALEMVRSEISESARNEGEIVLSPSHRCGG